MRWIPFVILLYIAAALQYARLCALGGQAPYPRLEYLPLLAVFYALYAAEDSAPIAALCCGVMYDLLSSLPLGTTTVALALVAWAVVRIRLSIFREHFLSQFVITTLALAAFGVLSTVLRLLLPRILGVGHADLAVGMALKTHIINALYTGIVAPAVYWMLFRMDHMLGFSLRGPRGRG